jgi:adenylate cyclase
MFLSGSVRAKLLTLVALPVVLMLGALPVLGWLLDRQLVDEVDDRVVDAKKSLQGELDDDLATLRLTVRVLAADPDLYRALDAHDARSASDLARLFSSVYPAVEILLVEPSGKVLAAVGKSPPPDTLDAIPELVNVGRTPEIAGIAKRGCAKADKGPARLFAAKAGTSGFVVACEHVDSAYVANAADKLGVELAVLLPGAADPIARSSAFPLVAIRAAKPDSSLIDEGATSWAVARFSPSWGTSKEDRVDVIAALDVSDVKAIVRRNLLFALAMLGIGAAGCLFVGSRLAIIMSQALVKISVGVRRLENAEYVKVDIPTTGDELEDLANGFNSMVDGLRERDKLKSTMGKYMTPAVIKHLMAGEVELGGKSLDVTILFTDIRSFTSISEKMKAHELVALLNEYFSAMVGVVLAHDGAVDKYIGDAIMAVFGAPIPGPKDAENAVRAAINMRKKLILLNAELEKRGIPEIRTGIGIHTGEVVAGNIGSPERMEYTVIGDSVNLASRLESNTKELGVDVLISDATYEKTKHFIEARPVKELTVKGRAQPVMTYAVLGFKGEAHVAK